MWEKFMRKVDENAREKENRRAEDEKLEECNENNVSG